MVAYTFNALRENLALNFIDLGILDFRRKGNALVGGKSYGKR